MKLLIGEATAAVRAEINAAAAMELAAAIEHYEHRLATAHAKTAAAQEAAVEHTDALITSDEAKALYRTMSMESGRWSSGFEEPWLAALPARNAEDREMRIKMIFITIVVLCAWRPCSKIVRALWPIAVDPVKAELRALRLLHHQQQQDVASSIEVIDLLLSRQARYQRALEAAALARVRVPAQIVNGARVRVQAQLLNVAPVRVPALISNGGCAGPGGQSRMALLLSALLYGFSWRAQGG